MFRDPQPHAEKRVTAAETIRIVDDVCVAVSDSVHPLALAMGVIDIICHCGWTPREMMARFPQTT